MSNAQTVTPETVAGAYTELREAVRDSPGSAVESTDQIRALATALTEDICDLQSAQDGQIIVPEHMDANDIADLLSAAAATLRSLVNDRDALMAAREWEYNTSAADQHRNPDVKTTESLLERLADEQNSTGDFDREELAGHAAWFHAIRNFVAHHIHDNRLEDQYQFDAFGVRPSMTLVGVHQLIDAARNGAEITADDLVWATQGPERLRGQHDVIAATPPCLRSTMGATTTHSDGEAR
ncbi:MAG: hypothetical protein WAV90_11285 [Gordonia amarae]